jgi:tetratricopeptide (TPR) repeat protein
MKNKTIYILSILLLIAISGCTKNELLDLKPDGIVTPSTYYITDDQALEALYSVYDPLQFEVWTGTTFMWGSIASDDATAGGADNSDQLDFQLIDRYQLTAYTATGQNNWSAYQQWWQLVARANYVIYNMKINDDIAKSVIDQAYFLKAFAYFQIVRMWGAAPIIDKVPLSTDKLTRNSIPEVWAAIERYLTTSLVDGKWKILVPGDGETTMAAAKTLLGKVYLYEGKYQNCIDILKQVDNGQYSLCSKFSDVFNPAFKHGVESIFEINFSSTGVGAGWDNNANSNTVFTLCAPRTSGNNSVPAPATFEWGWGVNQPTKKLAAAFDAMGDTARKNHSIISSDSIVKLFKNANVKDSMVNDENGWWDLKHARQKGYFTNTNQVNQNLVVLRLADVYLMLAEAYNMIGDNADALTYINKVRVRADLAPLSSVSLQQIKDERQLELCLEGDRYYDLIRWGDAEKVLTAPVYLTGPNAANSYAEGTPGTKTNGLMPIPQQEMNEYGKDTTIFHQNQGY